MDNKREEIVKYHLSMGQEISEVELNKTITMSEFNNYLLRVVESKSGLRRKIIDVEKFIKTIKNV
jgi:hypothetical protein